MLAGETVLASYFIQLSPLDTLTSGAAVLHAVQHWLFRFLIAYAISLAMLTYLRANVYAAAAAAVDQAPVRFGWAAAHLALLGPFIYLSARIYAGSPPAAAFAILAVAWHTCALAAVLALFAALAPFAVWRNAIRQTQGLPFYAILPAAAAVAAIKASQMLWAPAAKITFRIVRVLLRPLLPALHSDPASLVLGTERFAVQIAEQCSGLEGIGLLLAFCAGWLWLFRRDYYFPRALLIVPVGVLVIFLLNAVRIAAIVLIGNAGYERVAILGFHSQAGWIAFNLTAFGIAVLAQRTPWVSRVAHRSALPHGSLEPQNPAAGGNPTAAYLMPLLAILAAGMISHALSAGFEFLYPLRFVAALAALWVYRRGYRGADFRFTWRGPAVGILLFGLWVAAATLLIRPVGAPAPLTGLPEPLRALWISLPRDRRGGDGAPRRGARLSRLSAAASGQPTLRNGALRGGSMAGARRQRARVRPHARRSVAARHCRRSRLRRARDANRQTRRVRRGARHHQCAAGRVCVDVRSLAALVIISFGRKTLTMSISNVTAGDQVPREFNVIIEIPMNADPIKYEVDKESGALFVDRFMMTAMHYPANYGYVPQTISEDDDPVDVLVHTPFPLLPGVVVRCRALGMLRMEDESGGDAKVLAVPTDDICPLFTYWKSIEDVPEMRLKQIQHFFEHYKDLEPGKWVRVVGWAGVEAAHGEILGGVERHAAAKARPTSP